MQLSDAYLTAMGIQRWVRRQDAPDYSAGGPVAVAVPETGWEQLQASVASCTRCVLHRTRMRTVFGTGNRDADWMIIGEAPGADEDAQGEPFVGRAGQLLNEMLLAVGLERRQVYIANILKCRPPNNRNPLSEEVENCHEYLEAQIRLVNPRVILAVGGVAAHNLLHSDEKVGRLRGRLHWYGEQAIPLVVTYHPAYLLRSPLEKRKVWDDLRFAMQVVNGQLQAPASCSGQEHSR